MPLGGFLTCSMHCSVCSKCLWSGQKASRRLHPSSLKERRSHRLSCGRRAPTISAPSTLLVREYGRVIRAFDASYAPAQSAMQLCAAPHCAVRRAPSRTCTGGLLLEKRCEASLGSRQRRHRIGWESGGLKLGPAITKPAGSRKLEPPASVFQARPQALESWSWLFGAAA
jgi:hypothetical protein